MSERRTSTVIGFGGYVLRSELDAERALADALAADLTHLAGLVTDAHMSRFLEGITSLARYRETRQR